MPNHENQHRIHPAIAQGIAVAFAVAVLAFALSACSIGYSTSPPEKYLGSDTLGGARILGFLGDSSVALHRSGMIRDYFEGEEENHYLAKGYYSQVRAYNYRSRSYSEWISVPNFVDIEWVGEKVHYRDGGVRYALDLQSGIAVKLVPDPFPTVARKSDDGDFALACDDDSMFVLHQGKVVRMDSIRYTRGDCWGYFITSNSASKFLVTGGGQAILYAQIYPDGTASRLMESNEIAPNRSSVQNRGLIPFAVGSDGVQVPSFLDVDGSFTRAFRGIKRQEDLEHMEWSQSLDQFIMHNAVYNARDESLIYSMPEHAGLLW